MRCASDRQFLFDVDGGYNVFPIEIAASAQRPDFVIYSLSLRKILLIELTVPLEDRVAAAHTIKTTRYANLLTLYGPYILESVVHDGFAFIKKMVFHMSSMAIIGT